MQMNHDSMPAMQMNHGSMPIIMYGIHVKQRFFVCLIALVPILLLESPAGITLPFTLKVAGSLWVVAVCATFLFFYGGMLFFKGAAHELHNRRPAMMTLVVLGIATTYFYSMYSFVMQEFLQVSNPPQQFFWELGTLVVIMLLGHWLEMKATMSAGSALRQLANLLPQQAHVEQEDNQFKDMPLDQVSIGQTVLVKAGEKVPVDGVVLRGSSLVDESLVTGESRGVNKVAGSKVFGGSQNNNGSLYVRVSGVGKSGYVAQVMQLVSSAQKEKSHVEVLSDKVAGWLFYAAFGSGILAFVVWLAVTGSASEALTRMVTVFVIACPHALGLAIPLVAARSTAIGAQQGLLIRRREALETAMRANMVLFDKTGTLTEGAFRLAELHGFGLSDNETLAYMAGLEQGSAHPLAQSILAEAKQRDISPRPLNNTKTLPGYGVEGALADGSTVQLVNARYLDIQGIKYDTNQFESLAQRALTVSYLLVDNQVKGVIALGDEVKPSAQNTLSQLIERMITPVMLTGDSLPTARIVAKSLGIEEVHAHLMPVEKAQIVEQYQGHKKVVMMVGDGINDAPALARADVGIAIGAGTDVAIDSADVVLVKSDPQDIIRLLDLAAATTRKTKQNLWWGAGYNVIAIPLAAGVLAPLGIVLNPAVGAVLMSLSTIIVAANAMTLKKIA